MPGAFWKPGGDENPSWLHPRHARRDDRPALLPALDDEPARAGLVRAALPGAEPVPALRAVEPRLDAGAARLPVPARALDRDARAGAGAGRWATCVRRALHRRRLREPRARTRGATQRLAPRGGSPCRDARNAGTPPTLARQGLWIALAGTGSVLLLGDLESHHAERRVGAAAVDRAARALPAHVHPLLRRHGLVQARRLPVDGRGGARRHGLDAGRPEPHARARDPGRRVLHRPLHRLHVLPRRARAPQAVAALPDPLLPDDLAGRRGRLGPRRHPRAARAPRLLRAGRRARALRAAAAVAGRAATTRCSAILGLVVAVRDDRLRHLEHARVLRRTRSSRRATSTACCACGRSVRTSRTKRMLVHGTILHGNQYTRPGAAPRPDDLLHDDLGRRPRDRVEAPARRAASRSA